jgi:DNA helicase-2/ATP-dependent DNA helicase PcrA
MAMIYTEPQRNAIGHREGLLNIIACAGSGKTEVISRRIGECVREGTDRNSIVAFAFNEKAAAELKTRIRKHMEELVPDNPALGDMYIGTIHSFCLRLLKELDPSYRNYEVIDEVQQNALICSMFNYNQGRGIGLNRIKDQTGDSYFNTIRKFVNTLTVMHIENISPDGLQNPLLRDCVQQYRRLTRERPNCFLDFDSIIDETVRRLQEDLHAREYIQTHFRHIVVDEYQDIDPRQEELIRLLAASADSLCVVGDDDQAIYGWRGADIQNILTFERRNQGRNISRIELTDNFRSSHAIVEVANEAVRGLTQRLQKAMTARHWEGPVGQELLIETMAEQGDIHRRQLTSPEEEARYIAARILELRGVSIQEPNRPPRGLDWGDMAILLRSVRNSAQPLVDEFNRRGIPCVVKGIKGLFNHPEIWIIQAAFCQLANMGFSFIQGDQRLQLNDVQTREFIRNTVQRLRETQIMPHAEPQRFLAWIAEKRRVIHGDEAPRRIYPQNIFHEMLEVLGANAGPEPWPDAILYNLGRFSQLLTKYESVHQWVAPGNLFNLNIFINGWASHNTDEGGQDDPVSLNAVQILTVHAAKGLEWPVVFLPQICSRKFPSGRRNSGIEVLLAPNEYNGQRYVSGDDGELRLWYVALTRCRKFLHITSVRMPRVQPTDYFRNIRHDYVRDDGIDPAVRERIEPSRPTSTEILPTTYSDLNYYWECPFDYRLRRLMGFGPTIGQEFGYGQQIHNLLAAIHEHARNGGQVNEEFIDDLVESRFNLRYTRNEPLRLMMGAASRTLKRYIGYFPDLINQVFRAETPFEFILEGALINGTIDLLERVDVQTGERVPVGVIDFKTGIPEDDGELAQRIQSVDMQLRLYAIAVRNALNMEAHRAIAHFLSPDREHIRQEINIEEQRLDEIRDEVGQAVRNIVNGVFPRRPRNADRCQRCDNTKICPHRQN